MPLDVRFNESKGVYYGEITPFGHDETVALEVAAKERHDNIYKHWRNCDVRFFT